VRPRSRRCPSWLLCHVVSIRWPRRLSTRSWFCVVMDGWLQLRKPFAVSGLCIEPRTSILLPPALGVHVFKAPKSDAVDARLPAARRLHGHASYREADHVVRDGGSRRAGEHGAEVHEDDSEGREPVQVPQGPQEARIGVPFTVCDGASGARRSQRFWGGRDHFFMRLSWPPPWPPYPPQPGFASEWNPL